MEISQVNKMPEVQNNTPQGYFGSYAGGTGNPFSWGPALSDLAYDSNGMITHDSATVANNPGGVSPYDSIPSERKKNE